MDNDLVISGATTLVELRRLLDNRAGQRPEPPIRRRDLNRSWTLTPDESDPHDLYVAWGDGVRQRILIP